MEWQQLEYFRVLAKRLHFTQSAEELMISQPALSRSMAKLEEELGVPLFERYGRSVKLSQFGQLFLPRVERAIREIQNGLEEIQQYKNPMSGLVSLSFLHTLGTNIVPDVLGKFNQTYPHVEFRLSQNANPFILDQLLDGEFDICFMSQPESMQGIVWRELFLEPLFAFVPLNHPLGDRPSARLDQFKNDSFIAVQKGFSLRIIMNELCKMAGFEPKILFEGEEVATALGLVGAGLGIALLPAVVGLDYSKTHRIQITNPICQRPIGLAWAQKRHLSPSAELFRKFVLNYFFLQDEITPRKW
jgi:DNA-binding transcriptional LysR family regulator